MSWIYCTIEWVRASILILSTALEQMVHNNSRALHLHWKQTLYNVYDWCLCEGSIVTLISFTNVGHPAFPPYNLSPTLFPTYNSHIIYSKPWKNFIPFLTFQVFIEKKQSGTNTGCTIQGFGDLGEEDLSRVCYTHNSQLSCQTVGNKTENTEDEIWKRPKWGIKKGVNS